MESYNDELGVENLSIDASLSSGDVNSHNTEVNPITVEVIVDLEKEIDIFEKVSLVFLLYSDINVALQRLLAVEASLQSNQLSSVSEICLLSEWARTATRGCGKCASGSGSVLPYVTQTAFVEAICIVQDFKSLARIGYGNRSSGLRIREMSLKTPEKCFVNHTRNVLYRICECINPRAAEDLIKQVEQERNDLKHPFTPDPRLLEIVFLNWASRHFIGIADSMNVDIRNLSRHLMVLGEVGLAEMLNTHCPYSSKLKTMKEPKGSFTSEKKDLQSAIGEPPDSIPGGDRAGASLSITTDDYAPNVQTVKKTSSQKEIFESVVVKKSASERMERYRIDPKNMGLCIIVNQKNFYRERNPRLVGYLPKSPLEDRLGTDVDRDRLIEAFTSLGFDIRVESNLTHAQLLAVTRSVAANEVQEKHSCFVLCVLSHGQKDVVYGSNSIPVEIMELVELFCGSKCPALIDKPKIFIFQACQGSKLQKAPISNLATDGPEKYLSGVKDYVKFLSTVPGYVSLRHKITGSWFIENLYDEIMHREPNSSLLDVFTLVNAALDKKSSVLDNSLISMMSELHSTLRGPVILPREPEPMRAAALLSAQRILFDRLFDEFFASPVKCEAIFRKLRKC